MPIVFEERVTPRGRGYVRVGVTGVFDTAEAEAYVQHFTRGGPHFMRPTICVVTRGTEYTTEARKILVQVTEAGPTATVTSSPLVRAAINLMLRITGKSDTLRIFAAEPEALAWLDGQLDGR
ncbi:DUF7793 family protein [Nannocystis bainbridge]|uniref:DUF7793 domain-containing protein n=1 Tax=Nannocystis bainbridge TaxID=2995303 RepID=A0ABT5E1K6_9BACT|nr:hypothetical protein [Nannocystis bainbridge]MDC0719759.1 hypothetical protein [Nannocystis bainbridge]